MDGIVLINKEKGCTSHDVVYKVKKVFGQKVGHTGTLDPMATGVLPLLIGKGTLCSKYLINHDKTYNVTLELGKKTTTADSEGEIVKEELIDIKILNENKITKILNSFIGKQKQMPPIYSAIKVNGKKLYEYARQGKEVEIEPRNIEIYKIQLTKIDQDLNQISFKVSCSKGTYIRSLCEDIAEKLGTVGFMKELQRVQVGEFNIEETISVSELEKNCQNESFINQHFISIETLFEKTGKINLDTRKLTLFLNGVKLSTDNQDGIYRIYNNSKFIGIGEAKDKLLKRDIIL